MLEGVVIRNKFPWSNGSGNEIPGRTNGRTDGSTAGQSDGQTDRHVETSIHLSTVWIGYNKKTGNLNQYHTMTHFDAIKIYSCGKYCEKRRNCLLQAISPFLTMLSNL